MKPVLKRQEAAQVYHSGRQEVRADGESKIQIQHMRLRSEEIDEETKESERSQYVQINRPARYSTLPLLADFANHWSPGVMKKLREIGSPI